MMEPVSIETSQDWLRSRSYWGLVPDRLLNYISCYIDEFKLDHLMFSSGLEVDEMETGEFVSLNMVVII